MQTIPEFIEAYGQPLFTAMHPTGVEVLLFVDSECNYHLATDNPRPDKPEHFLLDALLNRIAELEKEAAAPKWQAYPMPGVSQFEITEAMQKARDTEAARVPLIEGWYGTCNGTPVAWVATIDEADDLLCREGIEEVGRMSLLRHKGHDISVFTPLREAYYAQ